MNTLYVHIGTTKTGTTAIQSFCIDNQEILNAKGYYYPLFPYRYTAVSERRNAHFLIAEDYAGRGGLFREGMDRIVELFQTYPNVILSDEGIWSAHYEQRMGMWKALRKESREHGFEVKIIVYLRRQDTYLISGWNQMVKSGFSEGAVISWNDYAGDRTVVNKMNYGTRLKKLADMWGRENIKVRRFEPKRFVNGSIYADFLQNIDLELTDEYHIEQSVRNVRLAGNTHEIQRVLNGLPNMNYTYHGFFRRALLAYADVSGEQYPCEMFSKEEAQEFMGRFEEENRMVSDLFFDGEDLFEMSWKDIPKWEKDNPYMQDDMVRFIGACFMQLIDENKKLKGEVKELKKMIRHPLHAIGKKSKKK